MLCICCACVVHMVCRNLRLPITSSCSMIDFLSITPISIAFKENLFSVKLLHNSVLISARKYGNNRETSVAIWVDGPMLGRVEEQIAGKTDGRVDRDWNDGRMESRIQRKINFNFSFISFYQCEARCRSLIRLSVTAGVAWSPKFIHTCHNDTNWHGKDNWNIVRSNRMLFEDIRMWFEDTIWDVTVRFFSVQIR